MRNEKKLAKNKSLITVLFCIAISISLMSSVNAHAQESSQLKNLVLKFGSKYSTQDGNQFANAILHDYVNGMDGGDYRNYDSMHKLIAKTWADMSIKYHFVSIHSANCEGIVNVTEDTGNSKWESTFVFVRGGSYGWKLITYRSRRM